jgi:hypothetical protein
MIQLKVSSLSVSPIKKNKKADLVAVKSSFKKLILQMEAKARTIKSSKRKWISKNHFKLARREYIKVINHMKTLTNFKILKAA